MQTLQLNKCFVPLKKSTSIHGQRKSQGKNIFFKVRLLSGNFVISLKSGKSLGILKEKVREKSGNFEM